MVLFFPLRVCNRILLTGYRKRPVYLSVITRRLRGRSSANRHRSLLEDISSPLDRPSHCVRVVPLAFRRIKIPSLTFSTILYAPFFFPPLPIHRSLSLDRMVFISPFTGDLCVLYISKKGFNSLLRLGRILSYYAIFNDYYYYYSVGRFFLFFSERAGLIQIFLLSLSYLSLRFHPFRFRGR